MNKKSFLKIIYSLVFIAIIAQLVGCKKIDEYKAIDTAKNFHYYIQQEDYKKAYLLMVKKRTREDIINFDNGWTKGDGFLSFDEFKSEFGKGNTKRIFKYSIKKIEVDKFRKKYKVVDLELENSSAGILIYIKKVDNSWKIISFSIPVP